MFIAEDGTGVDGATGYISIETFNFYCEKYGQDQLMQLCHNNKVELIRKATQTIDNIESGLMSFKGDKVNPEQWLEIPTDKIPLDDSFKITVFLACMSIQEGTNTKSIVMKRLDKHIVRESRFQRW